MEEDDPLYDLGDVLEDAPDQHHLADLYKLQLAGLTLQLGPGVWGLLVEERQLGILRSLEEIKVSHKVGWIVNFSYNKYKKNTIDLMYCEILTPIERRNIYFKTILLEILVDRQRLQTSNNLTCLVVHQTELVHS